MLLDHLWVWGTCEALHGTSRSQKWQNGSTSTHLKTYPPPNMSELRIHSQQHNPQHKIAKPPSFIRIHQSNQGHHDHFQKGNTVSHPLFPLQFRAKNIKKLSESTWFNHRFPPTSRCRSLHGTSPSLQSRHSNSEAICTELDEDSAGPAAAGTVTFENSAPVVLELYRI